MYRIVGRILDGSSVVGYAVAEIDSGIKVNMQTPEVEIMAKTGAIQNVKCTSKGLTGTNGFKLRELPSIQMSSGQKADKLKIKEGIREENVGRVTEKPLLTKIYIFSDKGTLRKISDTGNSLESFGVIVGWRVRNPNSIMNIDIGEISIKPKEEIILSMTTFQEIAHKLKEDTFSNAIIYLRPNNKYGLEYRGGLNTEDNREQVGIQQPDGTWELIDNKEYREAFGVQVANIKYKEQQDKIKRDSSRIRNSKGVLSMFNWEKRR